MDKTEIIRNNWVSIYNNFGFALKYEVAGYFDERPVLYIFLGWPQIFIHLPFKTGIHECEPPRIGIYYFGSALWFCLWKKVKAFYMPWSWNFYKRWEQIDGWSISGQEKHWVEVPRRAPHGKIGIKETHDYTYVLRSGEIQKRKAEIYVNKMEWRWLWFMYLPWPRKSQTCISIEFDQEVGEETGSWKGGCTGCSYEMKQGETALDTLRRMEKERKF